MRSLTEYRSNDLVGLILSRVSRVPVEKLKCNLCLVLSVIYRLFYVESPMEFLQNILKNRSGITITLVNVIGCMSRTTAGQGRDKPGTKVGQSRRQPF